MQLNSCFFHTIAKASRKEDNTENVFTIYGLKLVKERHRVIFEDAARVRRSRGFIDRSTTKHS